MFLLIFHTIYHYGNNNIMIYDTKRLSSNFASEIVGDSFAFKQTLKSARH